MPASRGRLAHWRLRAGIELVELLRLPLRYWKASLLIVPTALWLAMNYRVNLSPSMPWTLVRVEYGRLPHKGEFMLYEYRGTMEGMPSRTFFKQVVGGPDDRIRVAGRTVWVGSVLIGEAMRRTRAGRPLTIVAEGTIPSGFLFAKGEHPASFDSRYRESGLVPLDAVIGVAHPVF
jgi:conjugal transfer pilin signal peptidase TrbI